jgi:hypothetical protein
MKVGTTAAMAALRCASAVLLAATVPPGAAAEVASPTVGEWNFRALLDGKPIGQHRFSVTANANASANANANANASAPDVERQVLSEASFAVKFLGITAYRFRHMATEQWRGDCLTALSATTDDDGKASSVRTEADGDALTIKTAAATQSLNGCVMTFAYWNPAIQTQTRLLNAQTGRAETVQVSRAGNGSVEVRGQRVAATRFRITGLAQPIDVWYSAQGEWIGLDSLVAGGRKLSYRLQ